MTMGSRCSDLLRQRLDVGECPPRCSLHQIVKGRAESKLGNDRKCIWCRHYTKSLKAQRCLDCLGTENLDNFEVDKFIAEDPRYSFLKF